MSYFINDISYQLQQNAAVFAAAISASALSGPETDAVDLRGLKNSTQVKGFLWVYTLTSFIAGRATLASLKTVTLTVLVGCLSAWPVCLALYSHCTVRVNTGSPGHPLECC